MQNISSTNTSQPPIETTKSKKSRRLKKVLLIIVVIIIAPILLHYTGVEYSKWKMQNYLKDKYKKEFVVTNYRIEGAGLGVEGDPKVDARPKDDSSLSFVVTDAGAYKHGKHSYWDTYPEKIWEREFRREFYNTLVEVFDNGIDLQSVKISAALSALHGMQGDIPHYKTVFRKYGKDIYVSIRIKGGKVYDKLPERLYESIQALKVSGVSLRLDYRDARYRLQMGMHETAGITSIADISKWIEEVR